MADSEKPTNPGSPHSTGTTSAAGTSAGSAGAHSQHADAKERTRQTAHDMKDTAQQQARGLFEEQKGMAADQAGKLANALRKMAEELDAQDQRYFSSCATNLARSTDRLSERIRDRDVNALLSQACDYGRRRPAVFIGGAIATGFLLARFMRSSSERSHSQDNIHQHSQPQPSGPPDTVL